MTGGPVVPLVDAGLGNSAYLVDLGDGRALVVDASRDLRSVRSEAGRRGLRVAFAADSHLHADFVTGAVQLAACDGATVLAAKAGARRYPHTGLVDGDELELGQLRLHAIATAGHTDEHIAFLLLDGDRPLGVFTGGSLIVGAAGRTDLVDPARTEELARAQYRSLQRLATLPDDVAVWPTHGAGSFCSAPPGAERTSTIGTEKARNPLLAAADEDTFVVELLGSLGSYPSYFDRVGEVNRRGPGLLSTDPELLPLTPDRVRQLLRDGAVLVDTRPVTEFAAGHVAGALSITLRESFASWLGWLVRHDQPVVVLRGDGQDPAEIAWQAAKIGHDQVVGELAGGMPAAIVAGMRLSRTHLLGPGDEVRGPVVDVRQASEFAAGHLPAARHVELGGLAHAGLAHGEVAVVMCGHGERAMTAASLLEREGHRDVAVLTGGPESWATAHGIALERSG